MTATRAYIAVTSTDGRGSDLGTGNAGHGTYRHANHSMEPYLQLTNQHCSGVVFAGGLKSPRLTNAGEKRPHRSNGHPACS